MATAKAKEARVDRAIDLLSEGVSPAGVVRVLRMEFNISRATAHRDVSMARFTRDDELDSDVVDNIEGISLARRNLLNALARGDGIEAVRYTKILKELRSMAGFLGEEDLERAMNPRR